VMLAESACATRPLYVGECFCTSASQY
jgi:hypothetical protein